MDLRALPYTVAVGSFDSATAFDRQAAVLVCRALYYNPRSRP